MAGWIGSNAALGNALRVVGAQKDEEGRFVITGKEVSSFMGLGEEFVVPEETRYLKDGQQFGLAALMNQTSDRCPVVVITSE